jgi:hypothetical protein
MKLRLLTGIMIVFFALCSGAGAQAPLEKLRLTYSAIGGSQASVWIPYEAGIFRKHGLDVELLMSAAAVAPRKSCNRARCQSAYSPAAP